MDDNDYNPCPHGENHPKKCTVCNGNVKPRVIVYYTDGGDCYHINWWCGSLAHGQEHVKERGGIPSHIKTGFLDVLRVTRRPCEGDCTFETLPDDWGR